MLREKQKAQASSTNLGNTVLDPNEQLIDDRKHLCRICLEQNDCQYVNPCLCAGSIGWVHVECMKYHIYRHLEGSVLRKLPSGEYMRISCETCNREIRFEFDVSPRVDCSPCSDSHKTNTWSALFVVIVLFSILLGALLIVVIYYFTSQDGKDLFISFPAGIWVVISMVPLVAVGLLISIYYFVAENLYGNLIITRILNRGEKPHSKKKQPKLFDYERFRLDRE